MDRGDIYHVSLELTAGREQAGRRYVLIVMSEAAYAGFLFHCYFYSGRKNRSNAAKCACAI